MNGSSDLRSSRLASGLSAAALARAAGTSASNVAAYERGVKDPEPKTLARLYALISAGSNSPIFVYNLLTVPATSAALRSGLRHGWGSADLLRVVRECLSNTKWVVSRTDRDAFMFAPSTTGDRRWDALLAGAIEHHCLKAGADVPAWTHGRTAGGLWFVGSNESLHAYALTSSPTSLRVRGVLLDPDDLVSV
ncbi:MAG: helix-turn-helix domain-containing protein [Acidimicrobiales bacterium]